MCEFPGCHNVASHVHHLTYEHLYDEPLEDLQALCNLHHKSVHVWDRHPRCGCGRPIFDTIDDAIEFVAQDEWRDWDDLYAEIPPRCLRCLLTRSRAARPRDRGSSGGQHLTDPNTRTTMTTNSRPSRARAANLDDARMLARARANANGDGDDDDDDDDEAIDVKGLPVPEIVWEKWPDMEWLMASYGAEWDYHASVSLSKVDKELSRKNAARLGPRILKHKIRSMISIAAEAGVLHFPALLGYWHPTGMLVLGDGNHRHEFLRLMKVGHAAMYVLRNPDQVQIDGITLEANRLVGTGHSPDEQLRCGLRYYYSHPGCSYEAAAAHGGCSQKMLTQRVTADTLASRFARDGDLYVPGAGGLTVTERCALAKIKNDNMKQRAAIGLLAIPKHSARHAERIQLAIKKAKPANEARQTLAIDAEVAQLISEVLPGPRRSKQSKQVRVTRVLKGGWQQVEGLLNDPNPRAVLWDPKSRREVAEICDGYGRYLIGLAGELRDGQAEADPG
jgi:hypothetical protein